MRRQGRRESAPRPLPTRDCRVCGRPMTWRRRWARCWDKVGICSDACRRAAGQAARR